MQYNQTSQAWMVYAVRHKVIFIQTLDKNWQSTRLYFWKRKNVYVLLLNLWTARKGKSSSILSFAITQNVYLPNYICVISSLFAFFVFTLFTVLMKDRCKLFCRVAGTMAYYQLKDRVIDGTPCGPDTYDICVQGLCRVDFIFIHPLLNTVQTHCLQHSKPSLTVMLLYHKSSDVLICVQRHCICFYLIKWGPFSCEGFVVAVTLCAKFQVTNLWVTYLQKHSH